MRKRKAIIAQISSNQESLKGVDDLLMQYIFYAPKMPLRYKHESLLKEADRSFLSANDVHLRKGLVGFNSFKWGSGSHKIVLTHGWASKAADFYELIEALRNIDDIQIIAFDAPGNGSSEGELSHLPLYAESVNAVIGHYGSPDVLIGHSLGAMANIISVRDMDLHPSLLISLAPVVRLKENFEASMAAVNLPSTEKNIFFEHLAERYGVIVENYTLDKLYRPENVSKHILMYDFADSVAPYEYLEKFLDENPSIVSNRYEGVGHDKILKSDHVINNIAKEVASSIK